MNKFFYTFSSPLAAGSFPWYSANGQRWDGFRKKIESERIKSEIRCDLDLHVTLRQSVANIMPDAN